MGFLPNRGEGPPPAVAYWRDVIRNSRVGRFVARHKNASAAVAALYAVAKLWKWLIIDFVRVISHPGAAVHWAIGHVLLAVVMSAVVFVIAFGLARFGIDWFEASDEPPPERPRPPNRRADTHIPRGV